MLLNSYGNQIVRIVVVLVGKISMDLGDVTLSVVVNGITSKEGGIITCTRRNYLVLLFIFWNIEGMPGGATGIVTELVIEKTQSNKVLINEYRKSDW